VKYSPELAPTTLLRIEDLSVFLNTDRGALCALDGVSFSLVQGRSLGIVGESGCGKTMLCRAMIGLLPGGAVVSENAHVWFRQTDLLGLSERELNKVRAVGIAMVFQDPLSCLNPVMTAGDQIAETLVHHRRMKTKDARRRAVELLHAVGVPAPEQRAGQYPHQMSGGMRQRVAIAAALSCGPQVLIADEPTTALDVTVQEAVLDLLMQMQRNKKMGMILVTHDLGIAAVRTHEVAVMYAGRIVEQLPAEKLFYNMRMPYTHALVEAIPKMDRPPHTPLRVIEGQPPAPAARTTGCAFFPRCDRPLKRCRVETPPLRLGHDPRHRFACWNPVGKEGP
jgi:peptide/nickel transport system ATP-binding protein